MCLSMFFLQREDGRALLTRFKQNVINYLINFKMGSFMHGERWKPGGGTQDGALLRLHLSFGYAAGTTQSRVIVSLAASHNRHVRLYVVLHNAVSRQMRVHFCPR